MHAVCAFSICRYNHTLDQDLSVALYVRGSGLASEFAAAVALLSSHLHSHGSPGFVKGAAKDIAGLPDVTGTQLKGSYLKMYSTTSSDCLVAHSREAPDIRAAANPLSISLSQLVCAATAGHFVFTAACARVISVDRDAPTQHFSSHTSR